MEMDSSRRPFDRSRELNLKKPRLNEDPTMTNPNPNPNPRSFAAPRAGLNPVPARYRLREPDTNSNDSSRGGGGAASEAYQPQPVAAHQQQHQELIERYKSALSELTFNSKPIITNLTIIAGESLHAAKGIAATICNNIIEVPSDQKLPSLYLLDSIVKNIGRDYIKYFAARLPEVFCKAYRQVDPPIHSSMRHLFGTWKGVFHPQTLQMIEKELGFGSTANGSTGPTSRSDAQSQRPGHSIHVNPKYLERQRLQQSSRAKADDMTETLAASTEDAERLDRGSSITPGGQWMDPQSLQHTRRDPILEPEAVLDEDISVYRDHGYGSDVSRNTTLAAGRTSGRIIEQGHLKPWYGVGSNVSEPLSGQRNGFSVKHGLPSFPPPKSINVDVHRKPTPSIARSGAMSSSSWKNSEEEEFMWDSMDSRSNDDSSNIPSISHRDPWSLGGSERVELENNLPKDAGASADFGSLEGYRTGISALSTSTTSHSRVGIGTQVRSSYVGASRYGFPGTASLGSPGTAGQLRSQSLRSSSPSGQSFIGQHSTSPSDKANVHHEVPIEQDYPQIQTGARTDLRTPQFSGRLSAGSTDRYTKDSSAHVEKKFQLRELKSSSTLPSQTRQHPSISHQFQSDSSFKGLGQAKKPLPPHASGCELTSAGDSLATEHSASVTVMTSGQPSTTSPVAAANSVTSGIKKQSFSGGKPIQSQTSIKPPLPTGAPPVRAASSQLKAASLPLPSTTHEIMSISVDVSQAKSEPVEAEQSSTENGKTPDPISNLLTSLVAKGLISASKAELPTSKSLQSSKEPPKQGQNSPENGSGPLSSAAESAAVPIVSTVDEVSISEPDSKTPVMSPPLTSDEIKNLIGFEIRPDVIREFHSPVINELFDDFPHQCSICGVRLRLKERLDRHMEWHSSKESESNDKSTCRGWYANLSDWIAGEMRLPFGCESEGLDENLGDRMQTDMPMVPVDETQCACLLCGQLFDDYYDVKRDEWMFRGAVYLTMPPTDDNSFAKNEITNPVLIVHGHCLSESSLQDLGLSHNIKLEEDS